MTNKLTTTLLAAALCVAAASVDKPRVPRSSLAAMEKSLDQKVLGLWPDNPFALLGTTRGVYLEGFGAVFTAEVNLATGPTIMGGLSVKPEQIVALREKKLARLPEVKKALQQVMMNAAASLDGVAPEEQIVLAIFLYRYHWEDATGLPLQLQMIGQKKKLVDALRANGAGVDSVIRIQEQ
jgi:hypothetical protein